MEMQIPFIVGLLWPVLSTAITGVVKVLTSHLEDNIPPALWPIANGILAGVMVALQTTGSPQEMLAAVVPAILAALGLTKGLDLVKGKSSTVTPIDKKRIKARKFHGK